MFKLDRWDELKTDGHPAKTVEAAKELATEMCQEIFERLGLSTEYTPDSLRATGRGLTVIFPLRNEQVRLKDLSSRKGPRVVGRRGRPSIKKAMPR